MFNTKFILGNGRFDASQKKLFESDEDGVIIENKLPSANDAVAVVPQPDLEQLLAPTRAR